MNSYIWGQTSKVRNSKGEEVEAETITGNSIYRCNYFIEKLIQFFSLK